MVSVGGYLGLFIGLAMNDVAGIIVDIIKKIFEKLKMKCNHND